MTRSRAHYSIRQVIELTGVSEFLLRVWENRYGALQPGRGPTGRRLYTSNDVKKVSALMALRDRGHRIGQIATLNLPALERLLGEGASLPSSTQGPAASPGVTEALRAADKFDWDALATLLAKSRKQMGPERFILDLLSPLMAATGARVATGTFSIAQEHIFTALVREALATIPAPPRVSHRRRMVFATPEGDHHDLGLLMAERLARVRGVRTLFLGANTPATDLAETTLRFEASHLVLASTVSKREGAKEDLLQTVSFLDRNLDPKLGLWLAGRNAMLQPIRISRPHRIFSSFGDFAEALLDVH